MCPCQRTLVRTAVARLWIIDGVPLKPSEDTRRLGAQKVAHGGFRLTLDDTSGNDGHLIASARERW